MAEVTKVVVHGFQTAVGASDERSSGKRSQLEIGERRKRVRASNRAPTLDKKYIQDHGDDVLGAEGDGEKNEWGRMLVSRVELPLVARTQA